MGQRVAFFYKSTNFIFCTEFQNSDIHQHYSFITSLYIVVELGLNCKEKMVWNSYDETDGENAFALDPPSTSFFRVSSSVRDTENLHGSFLSKQDLHKLAKFEPL